MRYESAGDENRTKTILEDRFFYLKIKKSEHKIGVDFSSPWNLESSFNHVNFMMLFEAGQNVKDASKEVAA